MSAAAPGPTSAAAPGPTTAVSGVKRSADDASTRGTHGRSLRARDASRQPYVDVDPNLVAALSQSERRNKMQTSTKAIVYLHAHPIFREFLNLKNPAKSQVRDCRDLTSLCLRLCIGVKLRAASVPAISCLISRGPALYVIERKQQICDIDKCVPPRRVQRASACVREKVFRSLTRGYASSRNETSTRRYSCGSVCSRYMD